MWLIQEPIAFANTYNNREIFGTPAILSKKIMEK
jgi:hypothetical protein